MKTVILSVMLLSGFTLNAQSLKDLLYSGKLKKDSSGVIRKTDDLSSKIDTVRKTSVVQEAPKTSSTEKVKPPPPPPGTVIPEGDTTLAAIEQFEKNAPAEQKAAPAKSNTKLWKEHTDALTASLKAEVLPNKKVKKGTYFFIAEYELLPDGKVDVVNVTVTPESNILLDGVRSYLVTTPLQLAPSLDSNGQPKKVKRKQSFSITKE